MTVRQEVLAQQKRNNVRCIPFSADAFRRVVQHARGAETESGADIGVQTQYLGAYLEDLDAASLVVEDHYIDRHFIEEVALYYSRCLSSYPNWCTRIHVFTEMLDDEELASLIRSAATGSFDEVQSRLQQNYLGFIVVRPIPSVPIGRTILRPRGDSGNRQFPTTLASHAHLMGFELSVDGVPFQQQDRAVGACATTAIWTALQRVCRRDGGRAPTPSAITEAAVRHYLPEGRPFPSSGLTIEQICEAFRGFGFPPALFRVGDAPVWFLLLLQCYVRSGIPVLLAISSGQRDGHAVTVVGFREAASDLPRIPLHLEEEGSVEFRAGNLGFDQVYVHDDRLGPYARARLDVDGAKLRISIEFPDGTVDTQDVTHGLAPLYPKLRTTADEVFSASMDLAPIVSRLFGWKGEDRSIEVFFDRSGTYAASLFQAGAEPARLERFLRQASLSRYVGISRWSVGRTPLLDAVWDTTDTLREGRYGDHLIGLVARTPEIGTAVDRIGEELGVATG
ncbi:MAG: hypothetical protein ACT4PE_17060 [Candidatus Eiseniibacteriota bacterium]